MPPIFIYPSTILRIFLCTRRASHPLTPKTVSVVQAKVIPPQSCRHFRGCGNASDKQTISPTNAHSLSERTTSPVFGASPSLRACLGYTSWAMAGAPFDGLLHHSALASGTQVEQWLAQIREDDCLPGQMKKKYFRGAKIPQSNKRFLR